MNLINFLMLSFGVTIFVWAIAIFCFSRITVKFIETEMAKEGSLPPDWDKGIGARFIMYAMVIVAKKTARVSPVNDELILRHARKKDWYLAILFLTSFSVFMILAVIISYLYAPD